MSHIDDNIIDGIWPNQHNWQFSLHPNIIGLNNLHLIINSVSPVFNNVCNWDNQSKFQADLFWLEVIVHKVPVNQVGKITQVSCTHISVIDVISMFPDIYCQQWPVVACQGVASIRSVEDNKLPILILGKPSPAWSEIGNSLSWKISKELLNTTPLCHNLLLE